MTVLTELNTFQEARESGAERRGCSSGGIDKNRVSLSTISSDRVGDLLFLSFL